MKTADLSGRAFGRLTVVSRSAVNSPAGNRVQWVCQCECGTFATITGQLLRRGTTRSCGCLQREMAAARQRVHGLYNGVLRKTNTDKRGKLLASAKRRAKNFDIQFDLKISDIDIPARCPVLGFPMSFDGPREYMPTLDRIIPALGYVVGNVAVISMRANRLKSDAALHELEAVSAYIKRNTKLRIVA